MSLFFLTTNRGKYLRVKELGEEYQIRVEEQFSDIEELEVSDVKQVSLDKAVKAYKEVSSPVFVEDSGFYITAYPNKVNYPGTLVKRSGISTNIEGLLESMKNITDRSCSFVSCVTYYDGEDYRQFLSYSNGYLSKEKRGVLPDNARSRLWEVFIPEGYQKTLAEMSEEERKERSSKTTSAFRDFFEWYKSNLLEPKKVYEKM